MRGMSYQEREVKIPLDDADACAAALEAAGARPLEPRRLEDDRLFDDGEGSLARSDRVIRLRRKIPPEGGESGAGCVLTFKGPARVESGHRVREEIETGVEDADALLLLLERLGYRSTFRYQKRRRLYDWEGALIAVDETPLGDFLEIEGAAEAIEDLAARLGHESSEFLTASYPALWREARGEDGGDMLVEDEG